MNKDEPIDVIVAGGGMAGLFAAIAAGRAGSSVALIEPSNVLGGQGTSGGVAGFCGDTARVNDVFAELVRRLEEMGAISAYDPLADRREYELEYCGFVLQEMVCEAGVDVYLRSRVLDVDAHRGRVSKVRVATSGGGLVFEPRVVIDATGSCALVRQADLPVVHLGANKQLPMSLYFTMWDTGKPIRPVLPKGCPQWADDESLPMTTLHVFPTGKVEVKMKVVGFDAADGRSNSKAEMFARHQMMGLIYYLQTKGYQGTKLDRHVLASVSRQIGVREECRIQGECQLTEEEVKSEIVFEDAVAVGTYHLDYHWADRAERAGTGITTMVSPYHISLRCMIPKGGKNILVPGRSASGDQMAMSSFRVMAPVSQMGYAAGLAADLASREGCDVNTVPILKLQAKLEECGQSLDLSCYGEYLRHLIIQDELVQKQLDGWEYGDGSLARIKNSRFIQARSASRDQGPNEIMLLTRRGGGWSDPETVSFGMNLASRHPIVFADQQGRTRLIFWSCGKNGERDTPWISESDDGLSGWSTPRHIEGGHLDGDMCTAFGRKTVLLSDRSLMLAAERQHGRNRSVCFLSTADGGATWKEKTSPPPWRETGADLHASKTAFWESEPGTFHAIRLDSSGILWRSDSRDSGQAWGDWAPGDQRCDTDAGFDIALLGDRSLVLVAKMNRRLVIARSQDNGETWDQGLVLSENHSGNTKPCVACTNTGAAVFFTDEQRNTRFWHGSVERLLGPIPTETQPTLILNTASRRSIAKV